VIAITKACDGPAGALKQEKREKEHVEELSYGAENRMAKSTAINKD
jgi:hypothetical protein